MRESALLLLLCLAALAPAEPIIRPKTEAELRREEDERDAASDSDGDVIDPNVTIDICAHVDGTAGKAELIEDCGTLDQFPTTPPQLLNWKGASALICCPEPQNVRVFFPHELKQQGFTSDYSEEDYAFAPERPQDGDSSFQDEYQGDYEYDYSAEARTPQGTCDELANGTQCVDLDQCLQEDMTSSERPPTVCSYNDAKKGHKVCCKTSNAGERVKFVELNPRTRGNDRSTRYDCEDFVPQCAQWARSDPDSCTDSSHGSFVFMNFACMQSCGVCKDKGCVDELEQCDQWSKMWCANSPNFMSRYCRASCGFCGFYSARNNENQLVGGRSYTFLRDPKFYCGAGKLLEDIRQTKDEERSDQGFDDDLRSGGGDGIFAFSGSDGRRRKKRQAVGDNEEDQAELDLFYYKTDEDSGRGFQCGSTLINDRFAILAAHCLLSFGKPIGTAASPTILIRDDTQSTAQYAVKRYFTHPDYKYPLLYADIAIAELSRRIEYNYDYYGDTPACLGDQGADLGGQKATSEGYGRTENGTLSDVLLTVNVTVIENSDCGLYLKRNTTRNPALRAKLFRALRFGLNDQLLCTVGHFNKTLNVFSGPCEGDSGGPLYINHGSEDVGARRKQTVEGIVSGGLGCGKNTPSWFTRVSAYKDWIECIMHNVGRGRNRETVEKYCSVSKRIFEPENLIPLI